MKKSFLLPIFLNTISSALVLACDGPELIVRVQTDREPEETSWELYTDDDDVLVESRQFTAPSSSEWYKVCLLPDTEYKWYNRGSEADYCPGPCGRYELYLDGKMIAEGKGRDFLEDKRWDFRSPADFFDKCFCPVTKNSKNGKCRQNGGSQVHYKKFQSFFSAVNGIAQCEEFCTLEPDKRCKGFNWRADIKFNSTLPQDGQEENCYLYDFVPAKVRTANKKGTKNFEDWSCFALNGEADGYTLIPSSEDPIVGGKCRSPVLYGNTGVASTRADTLEDCKNWCDGRGLKCQGFDWDEGKASCFERRYKPNDVFVSSRNDYTDWFCHEKDCNC